MPSPAPPRTRRALRGAAALASAIALSAGGCGDDDEDAGAETTTTTAAPTTSSSTTAAPRSTTTTSTTASTTTTSTTAPATTTTAPFDGDTARVEIPRPATTQEVVAHTALEVTTGGGEERITFTFDGASPGVVVEYVDRPIRESGSGEEVAVQGDAVLEIRFEPAASARLDGEEVIRTYTGPDRVPGPGGTVTELVRVGDFEALYEWVVGLTAEVPFRVETSDEADTVTVVLPST